MTDQGYPGEQDPAGQAPYGNPQYVPHQPPQPPYQPPPPAQPPYQPPQPPQPPYQPPAPAYQPPQPDWHQQPQYDPSQYQQPQYDPSQYTQPYGQPPAYGAPPPQYPAAAAGGGGGHRGGWIAAALAVLIAVGVGAFFVFSGGSASASTPKDAVKKLLDAGKSNDAGAARKELCSADNKIGTADHLKDGGRITSYSIGKSVQSDSTHAQVTATVTTAGSAPETEALPVVKEGGSWKVCLSQLLTPGGGGASSVPSNSVPSGSFPSVAVPSISLPVSIPSIDLPSLPAGLPTDLPALTNPCGFSTTADAAAITYVGLAELGETSYAQACVYKDDVPTSVTASIKASGTGLFSPTGDTNGSTITFASLDGKTHVAVTAEKKDGSYYVTKVTTS